MTLFMWIVFLMTYRKSTYNEFRELVQLFQKGMNLMAVYGLYQFVGRLIGLPFTDFWLKGTFEFLPFQCVVQGTFLLFSVFGYQHIVVYPIFSAK